MENEKLFHGTADGQNQVWGEQHQPESGAEAATHWYTVCGIPQPWRMRNLPLWDNQQAYTYSNLLNG